MRSGRVRTFLQDPRETESTFKGEMQYRKMAESPKQMKQKLFALSPFSLATTVDRCDSAALQGQVESLY